MARDAYVVVNNTHIWTNTHQNVVQRIDCCYDVWNPPTPVTDGWSDMRLTVGKLQSLVAQAAQDHTRLRAYGGTWALSPTAVTNGRLINTKPLNWWFPLQAHHVSQDYSGTPANLVFTQCGVSIAELNNHLAARKSSLKTSGASNGQTIVGAIATGTHGSAIEVGSMQDCVVGMHIIVSSNKSIWLERRSYPVASDDFTTKLGAELKRDDTLFNAALVSFGSIGIIHGLVIETEPIYLLEATRTRMPIDAALRNAMCTLEFSGLALPHPNEKPFHFEVVVNPHDLKGGAFVTTMYKRKYRDDYTPPPLPPGGLGPGDDLLAVIGTMGDVAPALIPAAVNGFVSQTYQTYQMREGIHGEIFPSITVHGKGMGMEMGVGHTDASRVLDCLLEAHRDKGPFGGMFAFRFIRKSQALLAFSRFPYTCAVELPGVYSDRTARFFDRVWKGMDDAGIDYTMHWGQVNNYAAEKVRRMYRTDVVDEWMRCRRDLLDPAMREVFANPFLETCGLAG